MVPQRLFALSDGNDQRCEPESIEFDLDSFKNKGYLTHNFHPYPAKFVPQIPRKIIEALTVEGDLILDPFCGSGTALVEASILKRQSVGFDLNPIAALISRVKTTALSEDPFDEIDKTLRQIEKTFGQIMRGDEADSIKIPEFLNRDHWFQPHVLRELARLRDVIWGVSDEAARDFLKVAFSAIIVKVSNQDSDTRWVAVQKKITNGSTTSSFLLKAREMLKRIRHYAELEPACVEVHTQSLVDSQRVVKESVDLVVTSPPYLNSYDYYLYHKLRFFWLGLDHYSVQERELGSRHRHCDKGEGIETYTAGISATLEIIRSIIKSSKYVCIVIGDSILKSELIKMDSVYVSLCNRVGLKHVHTFSFDQRKYTSSFTPNLKSAYKQSHIMFFRK